MDASGALGWRSSSIPYRLTLGALVARAPEATSCRAPARRSDMIAVLAVISFVLGSGPATQPSWPLWTRYVEHFVQRDGRVVDHDRDELTTSEGQSYAMFFALVANDPASFDLVYQWSAAHLANGSVARNLPAWSWGRRPDGTWGIKDSNSASDADMWMAYDLIQAGRLWKRPDYTSAGEILLKLIASKEVLQVHGSPV